jgi:hypothetical protein
MRALTLAIAVVSLFAMTESASAIVLAPSSTYAWTLTGAAANGSGTLTTGAADAGGFDVSAITGSINGDTITGLIPNSPLGTPIASPDGNFVFDNLVFSSDPVLDNYGILFSLVDSPEANIYWGDISTFVYQQANANGSGVGSTGDPYAVDTSGTPEVFALAVPEPLTISVLGAGLVGAFGMRKRRKLPKAG